MDDVSTRREDLEKTVHKELNRLRGRLAGYIEALGLNERQERTLITTAKGFSYDAEKAIVDKLSS